MHFTCLEGWLNQASRDYCELCHFRFQASQSRRYSMLQSMWIWVSNRTNRSYLCYDALIALVLTALTVAIIFICLVKLAVTSCYISIYQELINSINIRLISVEMKAYFNKVVWMLTVPYFFLQGRKQEAINKYIE